MDKTERENFAKAVYEIVKLIPEGRATSYGAIAKAAGYPNMSRLTGKVLSEADCLSSGIPAHRVVNSQGMLSAKDSFDDLISMLQSEGITVKNDRISDWKKVFWNPLEEIKFDR